MLKKLLIGILLFMALAIGAGYFYLNRDISYPEITTSGLQKVSKSQIETISRDLSDHDSLQNITVDHGWFKDRTGRIMYLRGINVGGSSKVPKTPNIPTHIQNNFFESANTVSFVGRPFPLHEADRHFQRLNSWGFHLLRFVITWEGIEHAGPGIYDKDYLNYLHEIIKKAGKYHINVFIDPHQDVWSRFSGGDGAPAWTLKLAELDITKFQESGAAIVHNTYGDPFPPMVWPSNYQKLATATMFTLFFGGNDFAPTTMVNDSVHIQDFLQKHYIEAISQVALKLRDLPNVIGFDSFNEPSTGYIGVGDIRELNGIPIGSSPTPLQDMALGAGIPQSIGYFEFDGMGMKEIRRDTINRNHVNVWLHGKEGIWQKNGIWKLDSTDHPEAVKPNYFSKINGKKVNFTEDYFKPFLLKYTQAIEAIKSGFIIFAEPALMTTLPVIPKDEAKNLVNAEHWYDDITLFTKSYWPYFTIDLRNRDLVIGKKKVKENFVDQLGDIKKETMKTLGSQPTLIGEFGIPFDLNEKKAYNTGDFSSQIAALDRSFYALEQNLLSYTLWNYTSDNSNKRGDQWNGEDLSIFSKDQQQDPNDINSGGRALPTVIRPYPYKIAGLPIHYHFNYQKKEMVLQFKSDPKLLQPTEIFLPDYHFGHGFTVFCTGGRLQWDEENNMLLYYPSAGHEDQTILIHGE